MQTKDGCPSGTIMNNKTGKCDPRYRTEIINAMESAYPDIYEQSNFTNLQKAKQWGKGRENDARSYRVFDKVTGTFVAGQI